MSEYFPIQTVLIESLRTEVYEDRTAMGAVASSAAAARIRLLLATRPTIRMVFAAAPSQNEFLAGLCAEPDIDWSRITAFHMDEYVGLEAGSPQSFAHYLKEHLFDRVRPGTVHLLDPANGIEEECRRYAGLLGEAPIDIVCLGIGENGHLAFNDPPVADFADPEIVKAVELDLSCRVQQVNDGCFASLEEVPRYALTLTIPALLSAAHLFCMVPGQRKHAAIRSTLYDPLSTECPSTALRKHADCTLYTDAAGFGG